MREKAKAEKQNELAGGGIWALASSVKKTDPALSEALLREAGALAAAEQTSPVILADCAEAQFADAARPTPEDSAPRPAHAPQI